MMFRARTNLHCSRRGAGAPTRSLLSADTTSHGIKTHSPSNRSTQSMTSELNRPFSSSSFSLPHVASSAPVCFASFCLPRQASPSSSLVPFLSWKSNGRVSLPLASSSSSSSSPSMMLPAVHYCASRHCSSSSSQPTSEGESINNSKNEIDVTSCTENAKKILQDQKIAPLIFDENRTVEGIIPGDLLDPKCLEAEFQVKLPDLRANTNNVRDLMNNISSMRAIDFADRQYPSQHAELFKLHSDVIDNIRYARGDVFAAHMRDRNLADKLNRLRITTVYDWYSKPEVHRKFDASQVKEIIESCASVLADAIAIEATEVTDDFIDNIDYDPLTPGMSHRHTTPFGYGILARDDTLDKLFKKIKKFFPDVAKEYLVLFIIRSMPRQGKTRLGDELGYSKDFYGCLGGGTATVKNTFIFNLTFNTNWEVKPLVVESEPIPESFIKSTRLQAEETVKAAVLARFDLEKAADKKAIDEEKDAEKKHQLVEQYKKDFELKEGGTESRQEKIRRQVEVEFRISDETDMKRLARVERELCRRVVAAACGVYTWGAYSRLKEKRNICEAFIRLHNGNFRTVCEKVRDLVAANRRPRLDDGDNHFIFVFDEITNLEEVLGDSRALKAHFYGAITSLIDSHRAVLISGFSEAKEAISASDRRYCNITLSPISTVNLRREMHPMKTKYFSLCAPKPNEVSSEQSSKQSEAIKYYDLVKSAPGLLGTLIEGIQGAPEERLHDIVEAIPIVKTLRKNENDEVGGMLEVLQFKAVFFSEIQLTRSNSIYCDQLQSVDTPSIINTALKRGVEKKVADASLNSDHALKNLRTARLEPLFLQMISDHTQLVGLKLGQYWDQLEQFSSIRGKAILKIKRIRGRITDKMWIINKKDDRIKMLGRFIKENSSLPQEQLARLEEFAKAGTFDFSVSDLISFFLEDAIAAGILFQRQLRRQLRTREFTVPLDSTFSVKPFHNIEKSPRSSLSHYLDGSHVVFSSLDDDDNLDLADEIPADGDSSDDIDYSFEIDPNAPPPPPEKIPFPGIDILWWTPSDDCSPLSSTAPNIVEFDKHLPNIRRNAERYCIDACYWNKKLVTAADFNCDDILVPRRVNRNGAKENNPMADLIFHERFVRTSTTRDSLQQESEKEELVQFWIDGKHRKDEYFTEVTNENFASHIEAALKFDSRITDPTSKVRHIVHIIVTPFNVADPVFQKKEKDLKKKLRAANTSLAVRAPLESYTLCFVTPDDLSNKKAFENLVSQPIALTVPLIEHQMKESWTHRLPSPSGWWIYNATEGCQSRVTDRLEHNNIDQLPHKWCPVASRMKRVDDFTQWRKIRFTTDCAIGIGHLSKLKYVEAAGDEAAAEWSIIDPDKKKNSNSRKLKFIGGETDLRGFEIPFGCVLEALGILPPRCHGTSYCAYNVNDHRFKLLVVDVSSSKIRFNITIPDAKALSSSNTNSKWCLEVETDWLLDQIRVGHVLRCDYTALGTVSRDYEESTDMRKLWNSKFHEYKDMVKEGTLEDEMGTMTCSDLWNMSLSEFKKVFAVDECKEIEDLLAMVKDSERRERVKTLSLFIGKAIGESDFKIRRSN